MISRSRSVPTVAAMSIECTTSANNTVTCLYSADVAAGVIGVPHSLQNLEFGGSSVPHDPHDSPDAVTAPRPSPVPPMTVSCHRWSAMSVISPCHLRDEVLKLSYVVYFETAVNHRCWSCRRVPQRVLERIVTHEDIASKSRAMSPGATCCGQDWRRLRSGAAMPCSCCHSAG
jgi:hypothetical protein